MEEVQEWLESLGHEVDSLEALAGDVSVRRYIRVGIAASSTTTPTAIVAVYPEALRDTARRFERSSGLLATVGVRTPRILATATDQRFMLVEDLGRRTLFDAGPEPWDRLAAALAEAVEISRAIETLPVHTVSELNPPLDGALLCRELRMTWELYLEPKGLTGTGAFERRLWGALEALCERLEADGLVPCHRDFMARNLVPVEGSGDIAVIDHQDLRLGPRGYDLASLTNDSFFLSDRRAAAVLGTSVVDSGAYRRSAAQRLLKIAGTFVSFARRGSDRYLRFVPLCLERFAHHFGELEESSEVGEELAERWSEVRSTEGLLE
jgi:aminoglycoside/choline kinase family phosphotransferase